MDSAFDVGQKLVSLCTQGKNLEAVETLYAPDVESVEVHGMPEFPAHMKGIDAVRRKNQWWIDNLEMHGGEASPSYHWHVEIVPTLTAAAGFEVGTGFHINPMPPEEAARLLRAV